MLLQAAVAVAVSLPEQPRWLQTLPDSRGSDCGPYPAHRQFPVDVRAVQTIRRRPLRQNPGHRVAGCQPLEIGAPKLIPAGLRVHLGLPLAGQLGKKGYRAAVLDAV